MTRLGARVGDGLIPRAFAVPLRKMPAARGRPRPGPPSALPWPPSLPDRATVSRRRLASVVVNEPIPILIDCDTGIDDALALLYACALARGGARRGDLRGGQRGGAARSRENTRAVLELAGRGDIEVALGREVPLVTRRSMTDTRDARPAGTRLCGAAAARCSPLSAATRRTCIVEEARRATGRADARHARARSPTWPWRSSASPSCLGCCGAW